MKSKILHIRVDEKLFDLLASSAASQDESVSDFIRNTILMRMLKPAVVCSCGIILIESGAIHQGCEGNIFCSSCGSKIPFGKRS